MILEKHVSGRFLAGFGAHLGSMLRVEIECVQAKNDDSGRYAVKRDARSIWGSILAPQADSPRGQNEVFVP